jgi:putative DNA primase/helicase
LIVLDYDVKNDMPGAEALRVHETRGLPEGFRVRTASGGIHVYLQTDQPIESSDSKIAKGVDVRCEKKNNIVGPGSYVVDKQKGYEGPYTALSEITYPRDKLPEWIAAQCDKPRERTKTDNVPLVPEDETAIGLATYYLQHEAPEAYEGTRNDTLFVVAAFCKEYGVNEDTGGALISEHWIAKKCHPPVDGDEAERTIRSAYEDKKIVQGYRHPRAEFEPVELPDGGRAPICVTADKLTTIADKAERALIGAKLPIYARGGTLVKPVLETVRALKGRTTKVVRLREISADMLRDMLSQSATFVRYSTKTKKRTPIDPPHDIARTILSRDGSWGFPELAGVITTPTMRSDGSILSEPGYDPETRMLLLAPPPMPSIPKHPSRQQALDALATIDELLNEFPFVSDADRSVALSALMTPVLRGAMQVAPLHVITAPTPGSGKSYIIDLASVVASGERAPAIAAGRDEAETEKRLGAEMIEGQAIISIDNLNGLLAGDFLCQTIERPIVKTRVLGRSQNMRIENRATLFANGNNLAVVGDLTRRALACSLDANMERPEQRKFEADPVEQVLADRGRYVAEVLIIARAYVAAGCPNPCPPLASFEDWSRLVRSALVWLGRADPVDTMEKARADDPTLDDLRTVVSAWNTAVGLDCRLTAGALREKAQDDPSLSRALSAVAAAPGRTEIDPKRLGHWLKRHRGRIADNLKIHGELNRHTKQAEWWLVRADPHPDNEPVSHTVAKLPEWLE